MRLTDPGRPAERLVGDTLTLLRVVETMGDAIHDAIVASQPELHRWMDWAGPQPRTRDQTDEFITLARKEWDGGKAFNYAMTDAATGDVIGVCGLMTRQGPDRLEIGYWVRTDLTGRGIATAATRLLTAAGFGLAEIDRVEIHHDEANVASGRVPEKLGYTLTERNDVEKVAKAHTGVNLVWTITREDWS